MSDRHEHQCCDYDSEGDENATTACQKAINANFEHVHLPLPAVYNCLPLALANMDRPAANAGSLFIGGTAFAISSIT